MPRAEPNAVSPTPSIEHKPDVCARFVCPYCGEAEATEVACSACGARTDPLSRQATQNEMGPWFVRDPENPHRPGCRLETIERWVRSGKIHAETVIRGPSTTQNWAPARRVPGVARLFGRCHGCASEVEADEISCRVCGTHLHAERDRQHLGLSPVRELPGRDDPGAVADRLLVNEPAVSRVRTTISPAGMPTDVPVGHASDHRPDSTPRREVLLERRLVAARRHARIGITIAVILGAAVTTLALMNRGALPTPTSAGPMGPTLSDRDLSDTSSPVSSLEDHPSAENDPAD